MPRAFKKRTFSVNQKKSRFARISQDISYWLRHKAEAFKKANFY